MAVQTDRRRNDRESVLRSRRDARRRASDARSPHRRADASPLGSHRRSAKPLSRALAARGAPRQRRPRPARAPRRGSRRWIERRRRVGALGGAVRRSAASAHRQLRPDPGRAGARPVGGASRGVRSRRDDAGGLLPALVDRGRAEGARTAWRASVGELPSTLLAEPPASADVVFWDPFSPRANPELWTVAAFTALRRACREGATVHTYSGATAVRTALLLAGFAVGLGDMLRAGRQATVAATRGADLAAPLDRRWLDRVSRSSAAFASDAPADALERIARLPQFAR